MKNNEFKGQIKWDDYLFNYEAFDKFKKKRIKSVKDFINDEPSALYTNDQLIRFFSIYGAGEYSENDLKHFFVNEISKIPNEEIDIILNIIQTENKLFDLNNKYTIYLEKHLEELD